MSAEPLYCTHCGAEDKDCRHGFEDDGKGPFCEASYAHDWVEGRCIACGATELAYLGVEEDEIPW